MKELEKGDIGIGGCPCGEYKNKNYRIEAHCWKSSMCKKDCPFACVAYKAKKGYEEIAKEHAEKIKKYIEDSYMCECNLHKL
jgi:hypothetical protein